MTKAFVFIDTGDILVPCCCIDVVLYAASVETLGDISMVMQKPDVMLIAGLVFIVEGVGAMLVYWDGHLVSGEKLRIPKGLGFSRHAALCAFAQRFCGRS